MEVWIGRQGERHGPYQEDQIREWLRSGELSREDLGWYDGNFPLGYSVLFPYLGAQAFTKSTERAEEALVAKVTSLPLREARGVMLEQFERTYVAAKLRENVGNVTRTAESMGVSRQFVHRLMERYGLRSGE